jgi:ketosteroid isomerase-like protein
MTIADESIFINEAFYQAFRERDFAAMEDLWAREAPVVCIHPGWSAITERAEIIQTWQAIFENPEAPEIFCRSPQAFLLGEVSLVVCYEEMASSLLVATNIYRRESGGLKIVHHQAGPSNLPPDGLGEELDEETMQ